MVIEIPKLGLGTCYLKYPQQTVLAALNMGYRLVDTAVMYGNELQVGQGIAQWMDQDPAQNHREDVFYTTKLLDSQQGYDNAVRAISTSLKAVPRLGYIDLILIHSPQTNKMRRLETYQALQEAVDQGLVRYIGVSNYGVRHLKELLDWSGLKYKPYVNQVELNPWLQRTELVDFCKNNGILVEAYSPLTQAHKLRDPQLVNLASKYDKTPGQILLRWSVQKGFIPIPKTDKRERLQENLGALDFELVPEDVESLGDPKAYEYFDWDPTDYRG